MLQHLNLKLMKSRIFWKWTLGLSLSVLPFAGGCLQENSSSVQNSAAITPATGPEVVYQAQVAPPEAPVVAQAPMVAQDPGPGAPAEIGPEAPPLTNLVEAAVEPISTNLPPPVKATLTPAAAELVRLANSGVDESVMLAYVTNSPSTFNLGAEEIIYMNDLGVPAPVVTAMIQRDQALKAAGQAAMTASVEANRPELPAAPEQPQQQPAPADVAPQATAPLTPPPPPEGEVSTTAFYDSLAPYGSWVYVSGYGTCWRPTIAVVNTGWAPYFDGGRWVYTDWGWYWVSDYSWGWAPFHYGRWFRHHSWGWCWAPDTVWGPSWVAWRYNDAYCGWAPLPPGAYFTFGIGLTYRGRHCRDWDDCGMGPHHGHYVAWRDFDHRHGGGYRRYAVNDRERTAIYRETRAANNTTLNNHTVINRGVPRERVAAATQRDIRPVTVRETTAMAGARSGGQREQLRGNTLTVYRPVMPQPNRTDGRTDGTSTRRPATGTRTSLASAPSAESSPSAQAAPGTAARQPRPITGQTRTGTSVTRDREEPAIRPPVQPTRTAEPTRTRPLQTVTPPARQVPSDNATPITRPAPTSRTPQAAPARVPQAAPTPPAAVSRPPQLTPSPAPARQEPARQPATPPRSSVGPRPSTPSYMTAQRSYGAPAVQQPHTPATVQRQPPAMAVQVPRYAPSQPSYTPAPQRSFNATPSYSRPATSYSSPAASQSRPAMSVSPTPRPSAPAAQPMSAPRPSTPQPSPSSSSNSRNGR